jgi:ribosomal-protein-alanine N-acetyltransferase
MDNIKFSSLSRENVIAVHRIENEIFPSPWSMESFIGEINNEAANYIVMTHDDEVIGYGGMWKVLDEGHITNIAVTKSFQGKGLGRALVEEMIDMAEKLGIKHVTLEVRVSNEKAIGLYKKLGFEIAGTRKRYYADNNEDAYVMWVSL